MRLLSQAILAASLLTCSVLSRQISGSGKAVFFDSTGYSSALRITMSNVSVPPQGKVYVAWLVADNDTQYTQLGLLTVQGNGAVLLNYRDPVGGNLLGTHKKFFISQESDPFSGSKPTLAAVIFADSLHGPGAPTAGSPLALIRNCLVALPNTAQNLGLALWLLKHINDFTAHAGFARDGAVTGDVGAARTHSDHIYDFIQGKLTTLVTGNSSVATNGDPVGYGYRRYGDLGTRDSTQGGAGYLGGAGYQVSQVANQLTTTPQMKIAGERALIALTNAFGANNDAGWAKEITDQALKIINGAYTSLPTEGNLFYTLATKFINGTVGVTDTSAETGGIRQSYYHMQQMATFILKTPVAKLQFSKTSLAFGTIKAGTSKVDSVYVRNTGGNLLVIDSVQLSGLWYAVQPNSDSIAIGDSARFTVTYSPGAQGPHSASAIFFSSAATTRDTLFLEGSASDPSSVEADPGSVIPTHFALHQNFPNPFNSSTEIQFQIPRKSRVWIRIYNVIGQMVASLVEGEELQAGTYRMRWESTVGTGVYFCFLQARENGTPQFSAVRRMILLK